MKLPADCPHALISVIDFDWQIDCCCRVHGWDEPLCRVEPRESEVYRFTWRSSFDGAAVVHISREGDAITLGWEYRCFRVRTANDAPPVLALSLADWARLQNSLASARFWSLPPTSWERGLDGADWLIEGRRKDTYHAASRWSPRGSIYDLGRLFFALSGPPLARVKL